MSHQALSLAKLVVVTIPNGLYDEILNFNGLTDEMFSSHNKLTHKACMWTVSQEMNTFYRNSNNLKHSLCAADVYLSH